MTAAVSHGSRGLQFTTAHYFRAQTLSSQGTFINGSVLVNAMSDICA